ncbi:hypothetical protein Wcon_00669 [Wolbachia endosymbiont of Cylisticus convexus]|uniref:hypothetical protein n=1 Tax=Wolbachia endosymbiont of Cylisticus convexus TaxID=118728 RepID=UPI000DF696B7|nr:hypothetical protein [Wolbachia endosymbiont of Cylisticus convexus]RDD35202.1 hypothetical protein Wcon_00669 [Wolbachia endosymbiont of Cylisticus convexus]
MAGAVANRSPRILRALLDRGATFANQPSSIYSGREDYEQIVKFLAVRELEFKLSETVYLGFLLEDGYFPLTKQSEYWNRCLDEVKRMKEEKIYNNVTFYNVLTDDSNKLAYSAWRRVLLKTSEGDYKSKFPIYSNDLKHQLKIGNQRLDNLQIAERIIGEIFTEHVGHEGPFSRKIAEYLSNEDIENLRKATIQVQEPKRSLFYNNECGETSRCLAKDKNIIQPLKEAETKQIISKAIKTGVTLGIITALTIGIGCSIAGVELSILAIAGIAVAAALVIGVIAGGITYSVSKPSNKLDKPDLEVADQQVPEKA